MKKVLILTATAGNAHNSCAKSVKAKLDAEKADYQVKIIDLFKDCGNPFYAWIMDKGYKISVSKFLPIYNFFDKYKNLKPTTRYKNKTKNTALEVCPKLLKEIYEFKPDVVYGTHFYAGIILTYLKLAYDLPCKTIVSTLDYTNSPFWESSIGLDYLTLASDDLLEEFLNEGFTKEQLVVTGLPCGEEFYKKLDKHEARKQLGINENLFTIMVMFGGGYWDGGYKIFKDIVKCIKDKEVQLIMINGKNNAEYKKVERLKNKYTNLKIVNIGFTDNVALYMSAADILVNKMGGLSATEALNKTKPIIATKKLPSQEKWNLKYFENKGIAKSYKNKKELKAAIDCFMLDSQEIKQVEEKMSALRVNGIKNVVSIICQQPTATYDAEYIAKISYKNVEKNLRKALRYYDKIEKQKK